MTKKVTRLYQQFQPESYQLHLNINREEMTFSGTVKITGKKVGRPSQRLVFHQKGLKITNAWITKIDNKKGNQKIAIRRINHHQSLNEVRLHSEGQIYPGEYSLTIDFGGTISKGMHGIYPCHFKHNGQDKVLIATQFESHHAREAFPCIDEPEAKATFDLALTTPNSQETLLANTPIRKTFVENEKKTTYFEITPRMSTYLLAFAYGELGYKESKTKDGIVVRTYATPDNVALTAHSLDVAVRALEFFSDYFGIPYPLHKLDMLALPDFSSGAMENWGLVTYRETAMLADESTTSIESKQLIALVVAHELSHQWFGNLVTMKWWDDLWLNESFANLMEYRAVDALYPDWKIWEQFVISEGASAKRRDSLAEVQPIRTNVNHPDEISTLFDPSIVYAKGGTVLNMLRNYIGEKAFREGLKSYFEQHSYSNTEAGDLWQALTRAANKDITTFMAGWLNRPGYPLVNAIWAPGTKNVLLKQRRFVSDPSYTSVNKATWQIPLAATRQLSNLLLSDDEESVEILDDSDKPILLNHEGTSYFLPRYDTTAHLHAIVDAIKGGEVSTIDRLLLIDNYNLLQRGGEADTTELLDLITAYEHEQNESVWSAIALGLSEVRRLIEGDVTEDKLDELIARLVAPIIQTLGWDDGNDDAHTLRLRGLALSLAAGAKLQTVLDEGLKRFSKAKRPSDLAPSSRSVVYFIAARHGSDDDFQKLLDMHQTNQNADERDELAGGLTSAKQAKQCRQLIALLKTDEIRRQDLMHWWVWLLRNRYSREMAWQWLTKNWSWIENEFSSDKSYGFFARYAGSLYSRSDELEQFKNFFSPKKEIIALTRDIMLGEQEIDSRIAWRQRNESAVKDWLSSL